MKKKSAWAKHYSGELVAGVADEHASLPHSAVPHRDALDEPGHAGCHIQGPRWKKEISRARQRTRCEARSLFFCCLLWLWLLVEEERRKSDREGSHAFSLLSQVPLTGSHSCLRGHLFPSLFIWLSWCCFCFRQWPTGIWILFSPSQNGVYYPGTENCMSYLTLRSTMSFFQKKKSLLCCLGIWCSAIWWSGSEIPGVVMECVQFRFLSMQFAGSVWNAMIF